MEVVWTKFTFKNWSFDHFTHLESNTVACSYIYLRLYDIKCKVCSIYLLKEKNIFEFPNTDMNCMYYVELSEPCRGLFF